MHSSQISSSKKLQGMSLDNKKNKSSKSSNISVTILKQRPYNFPRDTGEMHKQGTIKLSKGNHLLISKSESASSLLFVNIDILISRLLLSLKIGEVTTTKRES